MVKRRSPVRVRKRALQQRRRAALFVQDALLVVRRAVGMERSMELSSAEVDLLRRRRVMGIGVRRLSPATRGHGKDNEVALITPISSLAVSGLAPG
jgi:hypothetical protein